MSNQPQSNNSDIFNLYFKLREHTEPPVIFHRWSFITCLSAYLGRQFWLPFGEQRIFPNFYTMLIGHPGARKSTAIKLAKKLLSSAGYSTYAAEKTSKEKFLLDLEGVQEELSDLNTGGRRTSKQFKASGGLTSDEILNNIFGSDDPAEAALKTAKEIFIVADEFNEFVGSGNLEFLSLLGMLWDWDDESNDYKFRLKNSKSVSIYQPTISILSGNTHAGFVEAFPPQSIGQGFLSRIILVYGEPSGKKIAIPRTPSVDLTAELVERLRKIKQTIVGPCKMSPEVEFSLQVIYNSWKELEDGRFKHYSNRRFTHLLKLLLVVCAARGRTEITEADIIYANTILSWTERDMPKALGEFGKSRDSEVASKIMNALYETKVPLQASDLLKVVSKDLDKMTQLTEIINKLINARQVQHISNQGYLPLQKAPNSKALFLDYNLLKEHQLAFPTTNRS